MHLRVLHRTRYDYQGHVDLAQHMLHLSPRDTACQRVLAHRLQITPEPAGRVLAPDAFGNQRTFLALQTPHAALQVEADSLVETHAPPPLEARPEAPAWEQVVERFRYHAQAIYDPAVEFLFASAHVPRADALAAEARSVFRPDLPLPLAAQALTQHLHTTLRYAPASTEVNTPTLQALAQRQGVCQDFAHIMIGCLRSLGLPARYVSGYLLTQPPAGQPRLIGADASHAWVSVYVPLPADAAADGPDRAAGVWLDCDPTNNRCGWGSPGEDYVTLALGRDFADVSPMRGVIQGGGGHRLQVGVTVAPPDEIAAALARQTASAAD